MVKIENLISEGKVSKINELEKKRYEDFFLVSYKDNLDHSKFCLDKYPRWSIISGYYAMHDIAKLLLCKQFSLKVEYNVHSTTIICLQELRKELVLKYEEGYNKFISLANDLATAKKERVKVQYYTGSNFSRENLKKMALDFFEGTVSSFIMEVNRLL